MLKTTNQAQRESGRLQPLSLYTHLPFCEARCLFCGCNVVITKQRDQAEKYLDFLFLEIDQVAALTAPKRPVVQYHWGGGTPTYLSPEQMSRLFTHHTERFQFAPDAEIAIEVDPRVTTLEHLQTLKELGFNRLSLGVQDFDAQVQETVRRHQPLEMTSEFTQHCRDLGFKGINFDLIYGLPHQTVASFEQTLDRVIELKPDRIALYHFAYVPWLSAHQTKLPEAAMPETAVKFRIFQTAIQKLTQAGYLYIGMDHFARPDDELALALQTGNLHRNFMGYTVLNSAEAELYGFGVSAISGLERHYAQNVKKLSEYYEAITKNQLPVHRGMALSIDDVLRRQVILDILCQGSVDFEVYQNKFGIDFERVFHQALQSLKPMADDTLLEWTCAGFSLTPLGRIFSRNIAMPFDAYLVAMKQQAGPTPTFSKTI